MIETRILDKAISLFQPDAARIELAKKRQAAIWNNQPADYLPLCLQTDVPESSEFGLDFDMVEEHEHLEVMFYKGLWGMIAAARSGSDSVPSIRPNFGTCFVPSMFGLEPDILPHTLPWLKKHLTKEQIKKFEVPDDVSNLGLMPKALVALDYYRGKLGDGFTYLADTQSPFDIAHLVRGDDIFLDLRPVRRPAIRAPPARACRGDVREGYEIDEAAERRAAQQRLPRQFPVDGKRRSEGLRRFVNVAVAGGGR